MSMGTCLKGNTHPCCSSVFPDDKNHGVILGADNEKKKWLYYLSTYNVLIMLKLELKW